MVDNNLAAPCGIYCGACRQYLLWKKDLLEERGYKIGCKGCRVRNKKCTFIRRDCPALRKKELEFCYECENFPCQKLQKLDTLKELRSKFKKSKELEKLKAYEREINMVKKNPKEFDCAFYIFQKIN